MDQIIVCNMKRMYLCKIIRFALFSIVFGCFLEYACNFDIAVYDGIKQNLYKYKECVMQEAEYINCEKIGDKIITKSNDAQIIFRNINVYAGYVEIQLQHAADHAWELQLYYSRQGSAFCEEESTALWISKHKSRIIVGADKELTDLRIDLGMEPDFEFQIKKICVNPSRSSYLLSLFQEFSGLRFLIYTSGIFFLILCLSDLKVAADILYRKRWLWGGMLILAGTILKLHGSSLGSLIQYHGLPGFDYGKLFGQYRIIRSDEYSVFTPMALSQVTEGFSWFSEKFRYSTTDMFMIYGQPVKTLLMIYRPFQIGYLLFGAERGLAFYWSSRLVICFLVSFEFGRILTKDDRMYAAAYAFLIALSPQLQWWFSINAFAEMLIFGQLSIVLLKRYIYAENLKRKILCMSGLVLCAGGYVLTMYPAWEISFFYVFLACAAAYVIEARKDIRIVRTDILVWFAGFFVLIASMAYVFMNSFETIQSELNTIYPGAKSVSGGSLSMLTELFRGWSSVLWSFVDTDNPCEAAGFIDFFPWGIVLSLVMMIGMKRKDSWAILLNVLNILLISFMGLKWPRGIAEITLLNKVAPERLEGAIGLLNLILFFKVISVVKIRKKYMIYIATAVSCFAASAVISNMGPQLNPSLNVLLICIVFALGLNIFHLEDGGKKWIVSLSICLSMIGGGLVNPVNSGLELLNDNPIVRSIARINDDKKGMWAVELGSPFLNSLPAVAGAKTLNSIHTYPDTELWKILGMEDDEEIWNRYAHINLCITDEKDFKNRLELLWQDQIRLYINIDSLRDIGVRYILSNQDLRQVDGVTCLYQYRTYFIYEISFSSKEPMSFI